MLKLLDGFIDNPDPNEGEEMICSLDVTELSPNNQLQMLTDMKVLYPAAQFYWHDCFHDDKGKCKVTEA